MNNWEIIEKSKNKSTRRDQTMLIHCILLTKSNYFNVHSKPNLSKNKHFMTRKPQESLQTTLYIILPFLYFQAPRSTLDRIANRFVNYLPGDTDKKQNQSDRQRALTQPPYHSSSFRIVTSVHHEPPPFDRWNYEQFIIFLFSKWLASRNHPWSPRIGMMGIRQVITYVTCLRG